MRPIFMVSSITESNNDAATNADHSPRIANPGRVSVAAACIGLLLGTSIACAQSQTDFGELPLSSPDTRSLVDTPEADFATPDASMPTTDEQSRKNRLILGTDIALVAAYGFGSWWKGGLSSSFRSVREGWFGQDTGYGGADKFGHAYSTYALARLMARGLESVGSEKSTAQSLGLKTAIGLMVGIEILDGFSERHHFSGEDVVMDLLGAGLAYATERYPELDRMMDFRLMYKPSRTSSFDPGGDYSGQTYLFVYKVGQTEALQRHAVLRYLEIAVGYGSRGYSESQPVDPHRNLYFGFSLNVAELLTRTVFKGPRNGTLPHRLSDQFFEYLQVPGTALLTSRTL